MKISKFKYLVPMFKTKIGFKFARMLQPYLSRTPVIWGDEKRLTLGDGVVLVNATLNLRSGKIKIGDYSFMGHGVMLLTGAHAIKKPGSRGKPMYMILEEILLLEGVFGLLQV